MPRALKYLFSWLFLPWLLLCTGCTYTQSSTSERETKVVRLSVPPPAARHPYTIIADRSDSRTYAWNGTDALDINIPYTVNYEKADTPTIEVRGWKTLVKSVHVGDGHILLKNGIWIYPSQSRVHVTIRAPTAPKMIISNVSKVHLDNLDQDHLELIVKDSALVRAWGRVGNLSVKTSDIAKADLTLLIALETVAEANNATKLHLNGAGNVHLYAKNMSDVSLAQKPDMLISHLSAVARFHPYY